MSTPGELLFEQPSEDTLKVILSGPWKLGKDLPASDVVLEKVKGAPSVLQIGIDAQGLAEWDTGLLIYLDDIWKFCGEEKIGLKSKGLALGLKNLLEFVGDATVAFLKMLRGKAQ